jgi:hypothetical protein
VACGGSSGLSSTIVDADCMTSKDGLTLDRFVVEHKDLAQAQAQGFDLEFDPDALAKALEMRLTAGLNGGGADEDYSPSTPSSFSPARMPKTGSCESLSLSLSPAESRRNSPQIRQGEADTHGLCP